MKEDVVRTELARAMMTAPNRMTEANINDTPVVYWEVHDVEELIKPILTLLDKEIQKARIDEIYKLNKAIATGGWHKENAIKIYPYLLDRIKQLEKGGEYDNNTSVN